MLLILPIRLLLLLLLLLLFLLLTQTSHSCMSPLTVKTTGGSSILYTAAFHYIQHYMYLYTILYLSGTVLYYIHHVGTVVMNTICILFMRSVILYYMPGVQAPNTFTTVQVIS
jgi:protein-S-isoprenylcysteine O-methyltransferase Ste14